MSSIIERLYEHSQRQDSYAKPPRAADRSIGRILLESGKLNDDDAERALRLAHQDGIRFGEACIRLKLVTSTDIERALSHQFDYPYLVPGESSLSEELIAAYYPFSAHVEAFRALRTQLLLRWFNLERRLLTIVSPARRDGRSYLAANLAIVFAQLGARTLLIDADMRSGRQHALFGVQNQYGLSALLAGRVNGASIETIAGFENLSLIPCGVAPPNPLELVSRPEFKDLLSNQTRGFDIVLVDTPPAEGSSDSQAITARAGGAVIVARQGKTRLGSVERLAGAIQSTNAEVVGSILNRF